MRSAWPSASRGPKDSDHADERQRDVVSRAARPSQPAEPAQPGKGPRAPLDDATQGQGDRDPEQGPSEAPLREPERSKPEREPAEEEPVGGRHEDDHGQRHIERARPAPVARLHTADGGVRPTPGENAATEREDEGDQAREQDALAVSKPRRHGAEPAVRRRQGQVGRGPGRELRHLVQAPDQADLAAHRPVRQQERQEQERDQRGGQGAPGHQLAEGRSRGGHREPGSEDHRGDRRDEPLVAGGQDLERERRGREPHVAPPGALGGPVESEEHERQPLVAQHLDVPELAESEVREGVDHGRHRGGARVTREVSDEPEHGQAGQGKCREPDQVVGQERPRAREARRADEGDQAQEVLGVGEGPAVGMKHVGVEEPERCRRQGVDVPRQDPRRQEGIPQVGHGGRKVRGGGPGQGDREGREDHPDEDALPQDPPRPRRSSRALSRDRREARAGRGPPGISHAPGTRGASGGGALRPGGCRAPGRRTRLRRRPGWRGRRPRTSW